MPKPKILIINDDGIDAPGIYALYEAVKDYADTTIVAPSTERSGSGSSITVTNPLLLHKHLWGDKEVYSVTGTPADCVKIAMHTVCEKPDLILSGINPGSNAGRSIFYSGTLGGIVEGANKEIPGIAFSQHDFLQKDFSKAQKYILPIVKYFQGNIPKGTIINISFPSLKEGSYKGFKITKQGLGFWQDNPEKRPHPHRSDDYYWLGVRYQEHPDDKETDVDYINQGYITATPLNVWDLTHYEYIKEHSQKFENFFQTLNQK
ncbi:MAG TPA: 5'/3'-nucleotidase SurE [Chlamydiales bacterium]|nr:5'/3'-nucleotidase SurE [Chlamydiales bacterium]